MYPQSTTIIRLLWCITQVSGARIAYTDLPVRDTTAVCEWLAAKGSYPPWVRMTFSELATLNAAVVCELHEELR